MTQGDFSRLSGVPRGVLSDYVNGVRRPGLKYGVMIAEATGGAVDGNYWTSLKLRPRMRTPSRVARLASLLKESKAKADRHSGGSH
jgi:hypothetical protein